MLEQKYLKELKEIIKKQVQNKNAQVFVFGSALEGDSFQDIDIGFQGDITIQDLSKIKEFFAESCFPYFVDVINFNKVSDDFKKEVFKDKILWIKK